MTSFEQKLNALRVRAQALETSPEVRAAELEKAGEHAANFLEALPGLPVYSPPGPRDEAMQAFAIGEGPGSLDNALGVVRDYVDGIGHNLGSSRFFGYIPSGGLYESALADFLAAVSNRYAGVGAAAPGATRMEHALLKWLANVVGYPETAEGDLTSGGSMATLSAVIAAREAAHLNSADFASAVVYATPHTHHTFQKALRVAGLKECVVREVALDQGLRIDAPDLRRCIERDLAAGLIPWLVAASAGTTDSGSVDRLEEIADIAQDFKVWMHVDAAYGGAFAICEEGRRRLRGIERSDSVVLNPHKGFFIPCGLGVVLVRDGEKLYDAYHARGTYMQDVAADTERSPCDYSAELTRPSRALRLWLPLKLHGTAAFAAALEEKLLLARYFFDEVQKIPGVEVGPEPDLSVVTFRFVPETEDADTFNRALVKAIAADGRVFLASTAIDDKFVIRMAILTYHSHLEDVDLALQVIRECAATILAGES